MIIFSVFVLWIALDVAKAALYWIDSSFLWNDSLNTLIINDTSPKSKWGLVCRWRKYRGKRFWNFWSKPIILLALDNTVIIYLLISSFESNISPISFWNGTALTETLFMIRTGWWVSLLLRLKTTSWSGFVLLQKPPEVFYKKIVLRNFVKFKGKHLRPEACNFIQKETLAQVFSCEFYEISKNTFFIEHLWTTASVIRIKANFPFVTPSLILVKSEPHRLRVQLCCVISSFMTEAVII